MIILNYKEEFLDGMTKLYNENKYLDPDFRPLSPYEFYIKFISLPYIKSEFIFIVKEENKVIGYTIADFDKLVERKFKKRILIIDSLVTERERLFEVGNILIKKIEEKAKQINAKEIQVHFIDSNDEQENKFYLENGFSLNRKWYYMETNAKRFDELDLPNNYEWIYIKDHEILRKWVKCYNEAFKEHYGMRPLRIKELKMYYKEEGFDPTGYFGIYDKEKEIVIGECSCEIDPSFNEYRKIKRGIIWTIGVIKEYRGKGFGEKLLQKAFNWFYDKGMEIIAIHVEEDNKVAYSLYSKYGFKIKRHRLFYSKSVF